MPGSSGYRSCLSLPVPARSSRAGESGSRARADRADTAGRPPCTLLMRAPGLVTPARGSNEHPCSKAARELSLFVAAQERSACAR